MTPYGTTVKHFGMARKGIPPFGANVPVGAGIAESEAILTSALARHRLQ